eukprot:CAMPEP_0172397068 /NCGR_PEP_ID=MMETSP1061-20121228/28798_1 /TAXON_ID=37318 /ORGANISM="Pseudo-nitzschia pungens, Strain cf. pungens" /LENGTH=1135 /DNA_ID=CAMNT_0013129133 /DNA_START=138 /DNA_END=3545 /DNA_ORIENTATION=+
MSKYSNAKKILIVVSFFALSMTIILPIILLELSTTNSNGLNHAPSSIQNVILKSNQALEKNMNAESLNAEAQQQLEISKKPRKVVDKVIKANKLKEDIKRPEISHSKEKKKEILKKSLAKDDTAEIVNIQATAEEKQRHRILARGVAGLPMSQTPALEGAKWGHVNCDVDVDDVVYWNEPQGKRDQNFVSPFGSQANKVEQSQRRYLTFEPDPGGWNNIRMSMEIIFTLAATTGRTLVLPPKAPFYLLGTGEKNARSFASFYDLSKDSFQKEVEVISMEEFFEREVLSEKVTQDDRILNFMTREQIQDLKDNETTKLCVYRDGAENHCENLYKHLRKAGYQPPLESRVNCFVFDQDVFNGKDVSDYLKERVDRFCGERTPRYYNQSMHEPELIHWDSSGVDPDKGGHRLLNHFYSFLFFTDPVVDNHYKRFVRDFLHYKDSLYCAAGKIIKALNSEGKEWSTLHVRRGDLQYKEVKIPADEWYENLKEIWNEGELLFIATDERNKTFFDPIREHHEVRFLDDYWAMANLGDFDPYFLSMIDTIVASHGRTFAGTWFSTFTGYINRMRGYLGYSMKDSWYSFLPRKEVMRDFKYPSGNYGAREWPIGWIGIDGDEVIEKEGTPVGSMEDTGSSNVSKVFEPKLPPSIELSEMSTDEIFHKLSTKRGLAGRPKEETPALDGASRGTIQCDLNVDSMAYWNDPQGTKDEKFVSPFSTNDSAEKYISFSTDRGGWNNVRMSMEIIFVIAAATERTLVLPPREPLYRLNADTAHKERGFADFFPLGTPEFAKRVKIISTAEFIKREGGIDGRLAIPEDMRDNVMNSAEVCVKRKKAKNFCDHIKHYLEDVGHTPEVGAGNDCIIFDKDLYDGQSTSDEVDNSISSFCGERNRFIWTSELNDHTLIHFRGDQKEYRLLAHFYNMIYFTDPSIDNHFKRFVRDFLHYNDEIYCAAGKIVKALQAEGMKFGFDTDEEGSGGYSAMHIRRGDFQYKKVKIPAEEWYENTKEIWKPNEIIFIATDERDKSFFDPIAKHYDIRFLDDYWELAGLGDIDSNYFGMIDTIVSSRARAFAGTWFSTFTGYINRMRGYHGMTMMDSWYSYLDRKSKMHEWENVDKSLYAYEWPDGWIGIDAEVRPEKTQF